MKEIKTESIIIEAIYHQFATRERNKSLPIIHIRLKKILNINRTICLMRGQVYIFIYNTVQTHINSIKHKSIELN